MNTNLILAVAVAAAGLLCGPILQPAVIGVLPSIGWGTISVFFIIGTLAPPVTLVILAAGSHYSAMSRVWSVFFLVAVFLISAGASALLFSSGSAWTTPSSFAFIALGLGSVAILGFLKLRLLRSQARKAARDASSAEPSCPPPDEGR
ncbi:hypothetical protein [Rhabdochromatium marinum]|uniref:hypothetical protein n=1 Tax=Rhabdochromatium marinum TaxID=48729 RepID=UPI0019074AFD|nr:hypothetical protein [Rhabdochromatium marinum]MBK1649444.1 hypothetical protein [Rhabdochromatium marinum]